MTEVTVTVRLYGRDASELVRRAEERRQPLHLCVADLLHAQLEPPHRPVTAEMDKATAIRRLHADGLSDGQMSLVAELDLSKEAIGRRRRALGLRPNPSPNQGVIKTRRQQ